MNVIYNKRNLENLVKIEDKLEEEDERSGRCGPQLTGGEAAR